MKLTLLVMQKLAYLLQSSGEPLRLQFTKGEYGPYAEALNHVLQRIDGHFIRGYGDRTTVADIQLDAAAAIAAQEFVDGSPATKQRVAEVDELIRGFESPFGLELLTTVHWAVRNGGARDAREAAMYVSQWNPRKRRVFDERHVGVAWGRLTDYGWL